MCSKQLAIYPALLVVLLVLPGHAFGSASASLDFYTSYLSRETLPGTATGTGSPDSSMHKDETTAIFKGNHDGHRDFNYQNVKNFQASNKVSYLPPGGNALVSDPGHSSTAAYGSADAGNLQMKGLSTAYSWGSSFYTEAWTTSTVSNSLKIMPGSSGAHAGDTVRLHMDLRLDGSMSASSASWPSIGNTYNQLLSDLTIRDTASYSSKLLSFGANTHIEAYDVRKDIWGYGFSSKLDSSWGVTTNTGINRRGSDSDTIKDYTIGESQTGSRNYSFDTHTLSLNFDAVVGHTLSIEGYLKVWAAASGDGVSSIYFLNTFGASLLPETPGLDLQWEIPPSPASAVPLPPAAGLLGLGAAALELLRRKLNRK